MRTPADSIAQRLLDAAFNTPRAPRSSEYKAGVYAALRYRTVADDVMATCPHKEGTAQADAWYAGVDEGHALWRKAQATDSGRPGAQA